jgi:hypothetical protein
VAATANIGVLSGVLGSSFDWAPRDYARHRQDRRTLRHTVKYGVRDSRVPRDCQVARPSSRSRDDNSRNIRVNPNVANLCRGKMRQGAPDLASHRLGQVEAYFTVREVLPEASKGADGVHWCEVSGFGRFRFAMLGLIKLRCLL